MLKGWRSAFTSTTSRVAMSASSIWRAMSPELAPSSNVIRWLLRPLVEESFLRRYLDLRSRSQVLEDAFWELPADVERPETDRERAWKHLRLWLGRTTDPVAWYQTLLG